jgi:hypothetical protein
MMLALILCFSVGLFAQTTGDYRTAGSGNWSNAATWQRYNGSTWLSAPSAPTGSGVITIQSTDSVYVDILVSIADTLRNQGKLGGTGSLTIVGTYQHDEPNGSIPQPTWANGSTCLVTGYTTGSKPNNSNQSYYNFAWNCPNQTSNVDLAMTGNTIGGNFTVMSTGVARVYFSSPNTFTSPVTVNGNVVVTGGILASNGSSSIATILITTHGNIIVTGGTFGVSRGSAPDVTWTLDGDFSVSNATLQNSGGTHINMLLFSGGHSHNISLSNVTYGTGTSYFTMQVDSNARVDLGTSVIGANNSGSFIVRPGGTLSTGNPTGINGAILCTGASNGGGNSFSTGANYVFNGSTAQSTGTNMPATVNDLTINNSANVTLSQATTINGVLHLVAGVFDNTIPFTLGPSGSISFEGGSLLISSVKSVKGLGIPRVFFVDQNYPNPFNPTTTVQFGLPARSFVSVKVFNVLGHEVATLFEGVQSAGVYSAEFDARELGSGVYFCRVQTEKSVIVKQMVLLK